MPETQSYKIQQRILINRGYLLLWIIYGGPKCFSLKTLSGFSIVVEANQ